MHGGDPGVRLFEPPAQPQGSYYDQVPQRFAPQQQALLAVPAHHVFGSEELSSLAAGVAERSPAPYVALCPADGQRLGLTPGEPARVRLDGLPPLTLPVVFRELAPGVAAIPSGLSGLPAWNLPAAAFVEGGAG